MCVSGGGCCAYVLGLELNVSFPGCITAHIVQCRSCDISCCGKLFCAPVCCRVMYRYAVLFILLLCYAGRAQVYCSLERHRGEHVTSFHLNRDDTGEFLLACSVDSSLHGADGGQGGRGWGCVYFNCK